MGEHTDISFLVHRAVAVARAGWNDNFNVGQKTDCIDNADAISRLAVHILSPIIDNANAETMVQYLKDVDYDEMLRNVLSPEDN